MTGMELYGAWQTKMADEDIGVDDWEDLSAGEQAAWESLAVWLGVE